jgi:L-threonylcarbamoyladenylate synthase
MDHLQNRQGPERFCPRQHLRQAVATLRSGGIVAYPTEAVYGLGCDPCNPEAVFRLLDLKGRSPKQGLILIAASYAGLRPFVEELPEDLMQRVWASWPGPATWVLPAQPQTPPWLTGRYQSLAVRVTAHPLAAALCASFGSALVSTSANRRGASPARTALGVRRRFARQLDYILPGQVGGARRPTEIRDARTNSLLRPG